MNGNNTELQTWKSDFSFSNQLRKAKYISLIIFISAGIGVWICGSLVKVHDGGWQVDTSNDTLLAMPCVTAPTSASPCGATTASRWGSFDLLLGNRRILIPTSLIGFLYFMAIILWFMLQPSAAHWTGYQWKITFIVQSCAILASIFWIIIMAKHRSGWCMDCIIVHFLNAIILTSTVWLRHSLIRSSGFGRSASPNRQMATYGLSPLMAGVSIAFVGFGCWLYYDTTIIARDFWRRHAVLEKLTNAFKEDPSYVLREFYAQPVNPVIKEATKDRISASVTNDNKPQLTVFTNYDNRASRCFEATLGGHIREAFGHRINVDFRHLPVHIPQGAVSTTTLTQSDTTDESLSCLAAVAAYEEGGFRAFSALRQELLVNQRHHTRADIAQMAKSIGLNQQALLTRMNAPEVVGKIESDMALAKQLGIEDAPVAYLNGRRVPTLCLNSEVFWKTIAQEMTAQANVTMDHLP